MSQEVVSRGRPLTVEELQEAARRGKRDFRFEAFMIVAEEYNPFRQPQKPTDGGKKKRKKKGAQ